MSLTPEYISLLAPSSGMTDLSLILLEEFFIKDSIPHSPYTALTPPHHQEYPWLWLALHSHLMFICVLNRPPNSDDSIYTSRSKNMDQLLSSHPNSLFLICGDFNCHHASSLRVGCSLTCHGTSAKDLCNSLGLTQSVNFPTRISTNGTPSLLDLILTHFPENICCFSYTPIGSSDHELVKVDISAVIREPPQHRRVWHFTQADWQGLQAAINEVCLKINGTDFTEILFQKIY